MNIENWEQFNSAKYIGIFENSDEQQYMSSDQIERNKKKRQNVQKIGIDTGDNKLTVNIYDTEYDEYIFNNVVVDFGTGITPDSRGNFFVIRKANVSYDAFKS